MPARDVQQPDSMEKRNVLASADISQEEVLALANAYLDGDALSDAANFFDKVGNTEGLERVKRRAIETGNTHVMSFDLGRSRHIELSTDDWRQTGDNAMAQGKFANAAFAFRRCGGDAKRDEARRRVPGVIFPENEEQAQG